MSFVSDPVVEASRLRAIATLGFADLPPGREFDALAALAAELLHCPIGMVTLIEGDRQWIAAGTGTAISETTRDDAFCDVTIRGRGAMIVPDARADDRFRDTGLVAGDAGLRAYAGIPISAADPESGTRVPIGAVCAIDRVPRSFTAEEQAVLDHLQALAEALFDARALRVRAEAQSEALRRSDRTFRQAERMAEMGSWRLELDSETLLWSDGVYRIYDIAPGTSPPLASALRYFPEHARGTVSGALAQTMETGAPFDIEVDFISEAGNRRRVRSMGELELQGGRPVAVVGVFQDVTARHALEHSLRRSASIDELTRIANRAAFNAELERWAAAATADGSPLELALIDLDLFKQINDRHGHLAGDEVLRAFGRRLRRVHPTDAYAARVGGDEFALLLRGDAARQAPDLIARLLDELKMPVHSSAGVIPVSGTIGHAAFDPREDGLHPFVHRADTALYQAKRDQRGTARAWGRLRAGDRRRDVRAA